MSNSLLSYGGSRDPVTGEQWGSVTANGSSLGELGQGGAHGVWASLGYHWLLGDNVARNNRTTAMTGYYYKLVDSPSERVRTGLTFIHFGYDKDLSGYTLGQGGYWSPQNYNSISVPVSYAGATKSGPCCWKAASAGRYRRAMAALTIRCVRC